MAEKMFDIQRSATQNATELQDFLKDLNSWEGDIKKKDDQLKNATKEDDHTNLPPVRGTQRQRPKGKKKKREDENENKENGANNEGKSTASSSPPPPSVSAAASSDASTTASKKPSAPRDYRAWDKINVDAMLAELEIADDQVKKVDESSPPESSSSEEEEEEEEDEEMTTTKREQKAAFEKERGNEFFKKGDYDRAIECYTTGISHDAESAVLLANRAMALLKQEKYGAAEVDCSAALVIDPSYVKALMRRGSARTALRKLDEAKTDFDDVLFLEPNNKQAHQELVRVKKMIDRRGFAKKSVDKDRKDGENKAVKFADDDCAASKSVKATTSPTKASSERVNSRWVTPISKPEEAVSKRPMRRIQIEEVGLTKEETEAKRAMEDKSKNRLNQLSEKDLKFFKGVGGDTREGEMRIDMTPSKDGGAKAKIEVLGKKPSIRQKESEGSANADKSSSVSSPLATSDSASSTSTSPPATPAYPSEAKIQVLSDSKNRDLERDKKIAHSKSAPPRKSTGNVHDGDDNPLQKSRISRGAGGKTDDFWQSVARDLDPARESSSSGTKTFESASEVAGPRGSRGDRGSGAGDASMDASSPNAATEKLSEESSTKTDVPLVSNSDVLSKLPNVPTTALQLQGDLRKLKKQSANLAFRYLASIPPASLPNIIKNMLDTDLVMSVVDTFHRFFIVDESSQVDVDVAGFLTALSRTSRFDMAVMFLESGDKKKIGELIDRLLVDNEKAVLRKKFGL